MSDLIVFTCHRLWTTSTPARPAVFRGLRVRTGIATDVVVIGAQTDNSAGIANI